MHAAPEPPAGAHTGSETRTLLSGSAENTTTEKSHCHLQRGCKSAAARSFPRCTHFPHTLTFGLPQISSPIKKRISNTSVQKTLESGEHEDSAPRNAISKTKLPVCLCMGRTEEAGEVKGGKKKNHRKQNLGDSFAPVSRLESLTFHAQQRPHGANCTRPTPCKHSLRQRRVQKDCLQQFFSCYRGRRYRFRFPSAQARLPGPNSLESSLFAYGRVRAVGWAGRGQGVRARPRGLYCPFKGRSGEARETRRPAGTGAGPAYYATSRKQTPGGRRRRGGVAGRERCKGEGCPHPTAPISGRYPAWKVLEAAFAAFPHLCPVSSLRWQRKLPWKRPLSLYLSPSFLNSV